MIVKSSCTLVLKSESRLIVKTNVAKRWIGYHVHLIYYYFASLLVVLFFNLNVNRIPRKYTMAPKPYASAKFPI